MKLFLLENDKKFNYAICEHLTYKDFKVVSSFDSSVLNETNLSDYDLFIISTDLDSESGLEALRFIKENNIENKVIVISSNDSIDELEKAFYYGCNEYMKKPFHLKELELRIYRVLGVSHIINIHNDLLFNKKSSNLYYKDSLINLRKKEKSLLELLVINRGRIVSKDEIIDYIWKDNNYDEYPIRQLISNLRDKLPANIIETKIGEGYKIS